MSEPEAKDLTGFTQLAAPLDIRIVDPDKDPIEALYAEALMAQNWGLDDAVPLYGKVLEKEPNHVRALNNLAVLIFQRGDAEGAIQLALKACNIDPSKMEPLQNISIFLSAKDRHWEAIEFANRCLTLAPDNIFAKASKGNSLNGLGQGAAARLMFKEVIQANKNYPEAWNGLAMAEWMNGHDDAAFEAIRRAVALDPAFTHAHENLGFMCLSRGEYPEGWREYESRRFPVLHTQGLPRYTGGPMLAPQRLLVWGEQGLGDHILQLTMLPSLANHRHLWLTDKRLLPLLHRATMRPTTVSAIPSDAKLSHQIPAMSLGPYFRPDPTWFPQYASPHMVADPLRTDEYRLRLAQGKDAIVGISWASSRAKYGNLKSTGLLDWIDLLGMAGCRFVSLQYGDHDEERAAFEADTGYKIETIPGLDVMKDLDGLGSLISACDLVITVSNVTAHLAGTLRVPCWVLVPTGIASFWHWGRTGDTTPWYKSVTLFRKQEPLSWGGTMRTVALRLLTWLQSRQHSAPNLRTEQATDV